MDLPNKTSHCKRFDIYCNSLLVIGAGDAPWLVKCSLSSGPYSAGQQRGGKADHVGVIDNAHAFLLLELTKLLMESFHPHPVHFRAEDARRGIRCRNSQL